MNRDINGRINPFTLHIKKRSLEEEYRAYSINEGIRQFRFAFAVGAVLFLMFMFIEHRVFPDVASLFLRIHLWISLPLMGMALLSTYTSWYVRFARIINLIAIFMAGLSVILLVVAGAGEKDIGMIHYYMYIIYFFLYSFFKMPYRDALFVGVVLMATYLTVEWLLVLQEMSKFEFYSLMLAAGNIVGTSVAYVMEYQAKKEFLLKKRLADSAIKDALTGLYNRHYFEQILVRDIEEFTTRTKGVTHIERRLGDMKTAKYGMFMIDIDHFKRVNDTFGHHSGDLVLKEFAKLLKENVRRTDDVIRFGGEEFLVVLKLTTDDYLLQFMKKVGKMIANHDFLTEGGSVIGCTVSMGLVVIPNTRSDDPRQLVNFADRALYRSKDRGRNRGHRVFELQGEVEFEEIHWDE